MLCLPSRWIVGVECDWKSQVSAGSERGQHPQHTSFHLLDFVSGPAVLLSAVSSLSDPLIQGVILFSNPFFSLETSQSLNKTLSILFETRKKIIYSLVYPLKWFLFSFSVFLLFFVCVIVLRSTTLMHLVLKSEMLCFRVVLLLLSSGYIGLRIVALEEQLTSLGALPEFTLQSG